MGGEHGVKNAGLVLDVLAEGGNVAEKVINTQGSWLQKLANVASLWDELVALTNLDTAELAKEVKELDAEDKAALVARFKAKFDLQDDKAEVLVEEGLDLAQSLGADIVKVIAWVKKLKEPAAPTA